MSDAAAELAPDDLVETLDEDEWLTLLLLMLEDDDAAGETF